MNIDLTRDDLRNLVKGCSVNYSGFDHPLVIRAGHSYSDQYGRTTWGSLNDLTDEELLELYKVCKDSWL